MRKMYFIGVTTGASWIHPIFPRWAKLAGVDDAVLVGADFRVDAAPESYRAVIGALREDPHAMGALVTTHKVRIFEHARDLFTDFDPAAERLGEVGCIIRRGNRMTGLAIDAVTAGIALRAISEPAPFAQALILGAGGAGVALASHLGAATLTDISPARVTQVRRLTSTPCVLVSGPEDHDRLLGVLPPGSLVVNATGMGKDRPGSPITSNARFPTGAVAWDLNYRGDLLFLQYARDQDIRAVDGWEYFLVSWSRIMSLVFGFDLTPELFTAMREAAAAFRRPRRGEAEV